MPILPMKNKVLIRSVAEKRLEGYKVILLNLALDLKLP